MKTVIIGAGVVGRGMKKIFPDAQFFDPIKECRKNNTILSGFMTKGDVNEFCDFAIVCVPTPLDKAHGYKADLTAIDEVFGWLKVPLVLIKSTVPVGTTDRLRKEKDLRICFSPEYMGESSYYTPPKYPDPSNPLSHSWVIVGGEKEDASEIIDLFKERMGPETRYETTDAKTAEFVKYMENVFFATKVAFCNELYECARVLGIDYNEARELWLLDPRINRNHTLVFPNKRGFGGKCLPKDLRSFIFQCLIADYDPKLLSQVLSTNNIIRNRSGGRGV
jgi:UDPglucose 6-dehydrogenase